MALLQTLLTLAYPPLIYLGLKTLEPRAVALCVLGVVGLRVLVASRSRLVEYTRAFWLPLVAVGAVATVTAVSNHPFSLFLGPALINLALLSVAGSSLLTTESTVEKLAKIQVPDLSQPELDYCRRVTGVWCGFFVLNGSVALALAFGGNVAVWTIYTGAVSYVLMGMLFAGEYIYRHWRFRRYVGASTDPILKLFFPPREDPAASRPAMSPEVVSERIGADELQQELRVPEVLDVWPGHFPEYSIVPGALQLHWVMDRIPRLRGAEVDLLKIETLKFKRPLLPGQKFQLVLEGQGRDRYRFRIADDEEIFSVGVLVFDNAGDRT